MPDMSTERYSIRGGREGRERLRLLSRVLHGSTCAVLDRAGVRAGQSVLDLGCGGGDVSRELARRVGPKGRVVGVDADAVKIELAQAEAHAEGLTQLRYVHADATANVASAAFDVVYARFLLSHLAQPQAVLHSAWAQLKPGGVFVVEDVDFSGHACWPEDRSARRAAELCADCMRAGGGDPNLGLRLPAMLQGAGFDAVQVHAFQALATTGDAKRMYPETLRNVADAVRRHGLASESAFAEVLDALEQYVARPDTLIGTPRIVQAWGRRRETAGPAARQRSRACRPGPQDDARPART